MFFRFVNSTDLMRSFTFHCVFGIDGNIGIDGYRYPYAQADSGLGGRRYVTPLDPSSGPGGWRYVTPLDPSSGLGRQH